VLEFYEDEIKAGYFQPISTTWFWHPTYAAVRKTERFKTVARDLGLVDYWRARGWPVARCDHSWNATSHGDSGLPPPDIEPPVQWPRR
jgi:hypothetical protein